MHCFLSNRDQVSDKRCLEKSSCAQGFSSDIKYKKIEGEGSRASVLFSRYSRTKYNRIKQSQLFKSDHDKGPRATEDSSSENNRAKIALGEGPRVLREPADKNNHNKGPRTQRFFSDFTYKSIVTRSKGFSLVRKLKNLLFSRPENLLNSRGSVLIEFAVCMPILIILLFYIHDLVRLKRYYSQTEFVAQQFANIIQNISQKRTNKKITRYDIKYAASLSYLSIFPGTTEFLTAPKTSYFGYVPLGFVFCVRGNADSTASVLWWHRFHMAWNSEFSPSTVSIDTFAGCRTNIRNLQNASPSEIYPTLKIAAGETKIIIEFALHYARFGYYFSDGRCAKDVSPSQAFGLRLFNLTVHSPTRNGNVNDAALFHSVVIFTPKPGLFDETAPV